MNNITGALYRGENNETKCSRVKSVLRQRQFKKPCVQAALEQQKWWRIPDSWRKTVPSTCSCHGKCMVAEQSL